MRRGEEVEEEEEGIREVDKNTETERKMREENKSLTRKKNRKKWLKKKERK